MMNDSRIGDLDFDVMPSGTGDAVLSPIPIIIAVIVVVWSVPAD